VVDASWTAETCLRALPPMSTMATRRGKRKRKRSQPAESKQTLAGLNKMMTSNSQEQSAPLLGSRALACLCPLSNRSLSKYMLRSRPYPYRSAQDGPLLEIPTKTPSSFNRPNSSFSSRARHANASSSIDQGWNFSMCWLNC